MKRLVTLAILITFFSCTKETVKFKDLIKEVQFIPKKELIADGQDAILVRILYNEESIIEKIDGSVQVTNAIIQESETNVLKLVPTRKLNDPILKDEIVTEFFVRSTTINSDHRLIFKINMFESDTTLIPSIESKPSAIDLKLSSFSVIQNFGSEITLTGNLKNSEGQKVSNGYTVQFRDVFPDGTPVDGKFRDEKLSSNKESQVSAVYTPGNVSANQEITLLVEVLGNDGNPLGIADSKSVTVIEKD